MNNILQLCKRNGAALFTLSALTLLVYFILIYYSIDNRPWIFYNSDSIYLPYLYQDLFFRNGPLTAWHFSSVPYFFPDTLLYFSLAYILQNLRLAMIGYAGLQFFLYYFLITQVGIAATKNETSKYLFSISVFLSLLLVGAGQLKQQTLNNALISQSHFGATLMFLAGSLLIIKTFTSSTRWHYCGLLILVFLTTFSDVLFLTQFVMSAICSLLLMMYFANAEQRLIYATNIFIMTTSAISSYLIYKAQFFYLHVDVVTHVGQWLGWQAIVTKCNKIYHNLYFFYQHNPLVTLALIAYIVISIFYLGYVFYQQRLNKKIVDPKFIFMHIILMMNIFVSFFSLLYLDNILMIPGTNQLRHIQTSILFPVFIGLPLYLTRSTQLMLNIKKYYLPIVFVIVVCAYYVSPHGSLSNILNFYPKSIACLDNHAQIYHLKNGASDDFWEARANSFLSEQQLQIVNLTYNKNHRLVKRTYFYTAEDYMGRDFTFLIIGTDPLNAADRSYSSSQRMREKQFGKYLFTFNCPAGDSGIIKIFVYPPGVMNKNIG